MSHDKITYRICPDEMKDLLDEGRRTRKSVATVARERMRSWSKVQKLFEELQRQIAEQRREILQLRFALAKGVTALLCRAGKETPDRADQWVRENLLPK